MADRDKQKITDILEAINYIEVFINNKSFENLNDDMLLKSAIMAQLMIIGEAAKSLSDELKNSTTDIEWHKVVGLRNVLIHEYFGVVWEIVWDTIKVDLPELKSKLEKIEYLKLDD